ncbi:Unknown protein sequence [Pseudomonas syringae pv. cilantro]|uniref:Uncharacterized protein n=1 Tax=Pseudomonas syringae pv. cilantro TaxID=81035 RepID=A0A0N0GDH7_PSESX|nr:Unknown protein sequence [Pseudomonas syringae pv. cilantro]
MTLPQAATCIRILIANSAPKAGAATIAGCVKLLHWARQPGRTLLSYVDKHPFSLANALTIPYQSKIFN